MTRRTLSRRAVLSGFGAAAATGWAPSVVHAEQTAGPCDPTRLAQILGEVARSRAGITTLTGPFVQERTIGLLAAKVRSTGSLTLVRPDRLRWELGPPDDVVYWVTPDGLAFRSAGGHGRVPAADARTTAALADLRVLLAGNLGELRTRYDIAGSCPEHGLLSFRATPKAGASGPFQEVSFTLASDLVSPLSVTIIEGPRDRTELHFGTLRVNVTVPAASMIPDA